MPVLTLADVTSFNAYQRSKLLGLVQETEPAARTWRSAPAKWTMLEHLEHLGLTGQLMADIISDQAATARREGLLAAPDAWRKVDVMPAFATVGLPGRKLQAPPELQPTGRSFEESLALLAAGGRRLETIVNTLTTIDTDKVTWYHPVAGVHLNLAQTWHFVGVHEASHRQQMQAIIEAWRSRRQSEGPQ